MRAMSVITLFALLPGLGIDSVFAANSVCVSDAAGLQTALDNASGSTAATSINVVRGIYHLAGSQLTFNSTAAGQGQLDITGGYNSDCSAQIKNPALTIIDGDNESGILSVQSTAGISVRYLTLQNGLKPDEAGLYIAISGSGLIVDYNIIRNNHASDETAGVYLVISGSGDLHLVGNLIAGNTAVTNSSAGGLENDGTGRAYVINNTVANNIITGPLLNGYGGLVVFDAASYVSNNILWGNTHFDISAFAGATLLDNDYGTLNGNPAGNSGFQSVDPQFSSSSDFHLLPTSPLLGAGSLTPPDNLPTIDIEGHPRSYNGAVDMGAYERGDKIFSEGFDD
jgi:hypothetical protein